jgi:hypothetical protein
MPEYPTPFAWEATPTGVAALLPTRTKGQFGGSGTWDDTTTPTLPQVEEICAWATSRIADKLRVSEAHDICVDGPIELAEEVATIRAAMRVELTYFANQLRTDQSPYKTLKEEYEDGLKDMLDQYRDTCPGAEGGDGTGPLGEEMPSGSFPVSSRVGRRRF